MPHPSPVHVPGTLYHVTLRGAYRSEVFFAPDNRRLLIDILDQVAERFAGKLHCYSNVNDCLQLLIEVGDEPLGRMMLRMSRRYAQSVQARLKRSSTEALPEPCDVVNRLFDMHFRIGARPQQQPGGANDCAVLGWLVKGLAIEPAVEPGTPASPRRLSQQCLERPMHFIGDAQPLPVNQR